MAGRETQHFFIFVSGGVSSARGFEKLGQGEMRVDIVRLQSNGFLQVLHSFLGNSL